MRNENFVCSQEDAGERIDKWLASKDIGATRSSIASMAEKGNITVNGKACAKNYKLRTGDEIEITVDDPVVLEAKPENIPLDIVYEDSSLLVVNKPKGMVVHPAPGNYSGTLVNALMYHCKDSLSGINGVIRPGIVHRIDKDTSGLLMVAKTDKAHVFLSEQIKQHSFTREYEAIAVGRFKEFSGTVSAPIGRDPANRLRMCVTVKNSKEAVTHFKVLAMNEKYTYLRLKLETGRTHQIRVHMAYKNHPLLGDELYGKKVKNLQGQCLYAKKLGFIHPESKEYMEFECDMPDYFRHIVETMEFLDYEKTDSLLH